MKFTLSWLKEYLDTDASLEEIAEKLTALGLEIEEVTDRSKELAPFIVAEILAAEKHPNADKLKICKVDNGSETLQIVCGAPNARAGIKVALAQEGVVIPNGNFKIKKSKIRDVESCGMMCSADELGIGDDSAGIIELPEAAKIGKPFAQFMGLDDPLIEIAITPNRGDCLGVYGIARDLAASGLGRLKESIMKPCESKFPSPISVKTEIESASFRGRYIRGVKNAQSPDWLKSRLESIGLNPISALVDITNYLTFAFGRPAHVYDADKLRGDLVVRNAKEGEKIITLDENEYILDSKMVVIAEDSASETSNNGSETNTSVAIAGIIGGLDSGCSLETENVFIEIAAFDPIDVATAGRKLQIDSDARYRFERGVDRGFMAEAMEIITRHIIDICGGEASEIVTAGVLEIATKKIILRPSKIQNLLGIEIEDKEVESILIALGFGVQAIDGALKITVPSWRNDISIEVDLIEEIARIYGYDNIPETKLPSEKALHRPALTLNQRRGFDVKRLLASRGLQEAVTFSFCSSKDAVLFDDSANDNCLQNPISADLDAMRPSILPNLLNAYSRNNARGFGDISLFEVGPIFSDITPEGQQIAVSAIRAGNISAKNHYGDARKIDVFDAKSDAFAVIAQYLLPENLNITRNVPDYYHPGKSGALSLGKNIIGYFGELHPNILKKMGIKSSISAFEIFVEKAPQAKAKKTASRAKMELSNFQSVQRDFAFIVDANIEVDSILKTVRKTDKKLIESVSLFDIYEGDNVASGKKSVAISVKLQPKTATLTDKEIEAVAANIIANVEKNTGAILRD